VFGEPRKLRVQESTRRTRADMSTRVYTSPGRAARARRVEAAKLRMEGGKPVPRLVVPQPAVNQTVPPGDAAAQAADEEMTERTCTSGMVLESDSDSDASESTDGSFATDGSAVTPDLAEAAAPRQSNFENLPRHTQTEEGALAPRGDRGAGEQVDQSEHDSLPPDTDVCTSEDRRASRELPSLPQSLFGPVLARSMKVSEAAAPSPQGDDRLSAAASADNAQAEKSCGAGQGGRGRSDVEEQVTSSFEPAVRAAQEEEEGDGTGTRKENRHHSGDQPAPPPAASGAGGSGAADDLKDTSRGGGMLEAVRDSVSSLLLQPLVSGAGATGAGAAPGGFSLWSSRSSTSTKPPSAAVTPGGLSRPLTCRELAQHHQYALQVCLMEAEEEGGGGGGGGEFCQGGRWL